MARKTDHLARTNHRDPQLRGEKTGAFGRARKQVFLDKLAETCNVRAAAAAAGIWPQTAYKHRDRYATFRNDWMAALASGYERLEMAMLERTIHGVRQDVWHAGKVVGDKVVYSDAAAMRLLALHRDTIKAQTPEEIDETYAIVRADLEQQLDEIRDRMGYAKD